MAEEAPAPDPATIDIGIFAHNEAGGIAAMLGELARQDLFCAPGRSVRVHLLANGCSDDTVAVARAAGLHTSRIDGSPLIYNQRDSKLPDLIVCRPELAEAVLAVTAG